MAQVVAGIGISHAPGALGWPELPAPEVRARLEAAARTLGRRLEQARPDVVIAFLDDHFENQFRNLMPQITIAVADAHRGPAAQWLEPLRLKAPRDYPGAPQIAERLLWALVADHFDVARQGPIEYGNNLVVPWEMMKPDIDCAIVPVFTNIFSRPIIPYRRAFDFGRAVRRAVDAMDDSLRVAFLATGGLSHWPPFWNEASAPDDAFLQRIKVFQTEGRPALQKDPSLMNDLAAYEVEMARKSTRPLVNAAWDRGILEAVAKGEVDRLCGLGFEEVEREGGHGGHEVLNWVELVGAMNGGTATVIEYEPVTEWICGMAYVDFHT